MIGPYSPYDYPPYDYSHLNQMSPNYSRLDDFLLGLYVLNNNKKGIGLTAKDVANLLGYDDYLTETIALELRRLGYVQMGVGWSIALTDQGLDIARGLEKSLPLAEKRPIDRFLLRLYELSENGKNNSSMMDVGISIDMDLNCVNEIVLGLRKEDCVFPGLGSLITLAPRGKFLAQCMVSKPIESAPVEQDVQVRFNTTVINAQNVSSQNDIVDPKCFISYKWDDSDECNTQWVLKLATRLQENGVMTYIDQWDVFPGKDLTQYMEGSIRDSNYVLLICTPKFKARADVGKGGVGYEKMIVTGSIYSGEKEGKFIPILRIGSMEESMPDYLKSKTHVDFRDDKKFDEKLEQLLRCVFNEPVSKRPQLGPRPKFTSKLPYYGTG